MNANIRKAKLIIPFTRSFSLLFYDSNGRIARELWWTNQEFALSTAFHHGSPCSYIT
jgi:hypothetical protein